MTTKNESTIKPEIKELADKIKAEGALTIDKKTGEATVSADTYVKLLPAELTEEIVKKVQTYNTQMLTAAAHVLGHTSLPVMKKNTELDRTFLKMPMTGKDTINVTFDRSRTYAGGVTDGKANDPITKYGVVNASIDFYGSKANGDMLKVKNDLADAAMAAFGK